MISMPGMLMIGADGRGLGKTTFTCALIRRFSSQHDLVAAKITVGNPLDESPRSRTAGPVSEGYAPTRPGQHPAFYLTEEQDRQTGKDTSRMLASGARRVLWLRAADDHLEDGIAALLHALEPGTVSICESTRARRWIEPGAFIIIRGTRVADRKPWSEELARYADRVVTSDGFTFDTDFNEIELVGRRWAVRMSATAIVLAGGAGTRMGADKALLPIRGRPMIRHIHEQLRPWFARVLVSTNSVSVPCGPGAILVPDEVSGRGPLMGLVSALKASGDELNFVTACDIPDIDIDLVRAMVRAAGDCDAVVPRSAAGRNEPLFAVYNKRALPVLEKVLSSGTNRVTDALRQCRVRYLACAEGRIRNINTMSEYRQYIEETTDADP